MFRRNNSIWRKALVSKSSSVASNQVILQTKWYKRILRKTFQFHGTFHGLKIANFFHKTSLAKGSGLKKYDLLALENCVHVCNRARNVHLNIYDAHKMYVYVTCMNKLFLNFVWLIYLCFSILAYRLFTLRLYKPAFFRNTKLLSIKICSLCSRILHFSYQKFKFRMVAISSFNYCWNNSYVIILCFTSRVIRSPLRTQMTFM